MKWFVPILGIFGLYAVLIPTGLMVAAQEQPVPAVQPAAPAAVNIVVYQRPGNPVVVHLHGASGEVHVWIVEEVAPAAAQDEEQKKIEALKRLREGK